MNADLVKQDGGAVVERGEYFATRGLSNSGLKDLAVSPYRFWHIHVNPDAPLVEETPAMRFGSALHAAVLEPEEFQKRYVCEIDASDFPGCLVTMDDLRGWLRDHGAIPKGTRKADAIAQVQCADGDDAAVILDVELEKFRSCTEGKTVLRKDEWERVHGAAASLLSEPRVKEILAEGRPEVSYFVTDPETGVPLKSRMDWVRPSLTLDLKTFTQMRGKSISKSVADAIYYERYYIQAYFYSMVRSLAEGNTAKSGPQTAPEFVLAFVESDPPHEVRLRSLRPKFGGEVNVYWEKARIEVRGLVREYAECMKRFGTDKPWRYAQEIDPLVDLDMKGIAFD